MKRTPLVMAVTLFSLGMPRLQGAQEDPEIIKSREAVQQIKDTEAQLQSIRKKISAQKAQQSPQAARLALEASEKQKTELEKAKNEALNFVEQAYNTMLSSAPAIETDTVKEKETEGKERAKTGLTKKTYLGPKKLPSELAKELAAISKKITDLRDDHFQTAELIVENFEDISDPENQTLEMFNLLKQSTQYAQEKIAALDVAIKAELRTYYRTTSVHAESKYLQEHEQEEARKAKEAQEALARQARKQEEQRRQKEEKIQKDVQEAQLGKEKRTRKSQPEPQSLGTSLADMPGFAAAFPAKPAPRSLGEQLGLPEKLGEAKPPMTQQQKTTPQPTTTKKKYGTIQKRKVTPADLETMDLPGLFAEEKPRGEEPLEETIAPTQAQQITITLPAAGQKAQEQLVQKPAEFRAEEFTSNQEREKLLETARSLKAKILQWQAEIARTTTEEDKEILQEKIEEAKELTTALDRVVDETKESNLTEEKRAELAQEATELQADATSLTTAPPQQEAELPTAIEQEPKLPIQTKEEAEIPQENLRRAQAMLEKGTSLDKLVSKNLKDLASQVPNWTRSKFESNLRAFEAKLETETKNTRATIDKFGLNSQEAKAQQLKKLEAEAKIRALKLIYNPEIADAARTFSKTTHLSLDSVIHQVRLKVLLNTHAKLENQNVSIKKLQESSQKIQNTHEKIKQIHTERRAR